MATIDQGGFGYRNRQSVPQTVVTPAAAYDKSGTQALAGGGQELLGTIDATQQAGRHILDSAAEHSRLRFEHKVKEENRARATAALVDYDLDVKTAGDSVAQDLQDGKITREQVPGMFTDAEAKVRENTMQQIPQEQQEFVQGRLAKAAERVQLGLTAVAEKHRSSEIFGYVENITDAMRKQAALPGADLTRIQTEYDAAIRAIGPSAKLNPAQIEKGAQNFKDGTTVDYLVARMNERLDSLPGLKDIKGQIQDTKGYPNLDPDKRSILLHSVNASIARLEQKTAADQSRVYAETMGDMMDLNKDIDAGYTHPAPDMVSMQERTKGIPALEAQFARLNALNGFMGQFTHAPVSDMEAAWLRTDTQVRANPSPEGRMMVESLGKLIETKRKELIEWPAMAAVKYGFAPDTTLNWASPPELAVAFQSRNAGTSAQKAQNPGAGRGLLHRGEAMELNGLMETQPPKTQAQLLGLIAGSINDPVAFAATMVQLKKESHSYAHAGMLMLWKQPEAATAVLDGEHLMKDSKGAQTIPSDEKFRDVWRSVVGNAYSASSETDDQDFEAAKMIYVSLSRKAGKTAQSDVDTGIWRKSIKMATGGHADINSKDIVLPYGVDSSETRRRAQKAIDLAFPSNEIAGAKMGKVQNTVPPDATPAGQFHRDDTDERILKLKKLDLYTEETGVPGAMSRDYIKDLPLESVAQGQYRIVNGLNYIQNDNGNPLILDLRKETPSYYFDPHTNTGVTTIHETSPTGEVIIRKLAPPQHVDPVALPAPEPVGDAPKPVSKKEMKQELKPIIQNRLNPMNEAKPAMGDLSNLKFPPLPDNVSKGEAEKLHKEINQYKSIITDPKHSEEVRDNALKEMARRVLRLGASMEDIMKATRKPADWFNFR